jgi:UDP-glucose 4-epimerase
MKYIITGGAGFIGSHLCDYLLELKSTQKIIIIDNLKDGSKKNLKLSLKNKKVKLYKKDIKNKEKIFNLFKNIDVVFHLAAQSDIVPSIENPIEYYQSNVNGTLNILETMRDQNVKKIIFAASSSCYGIPKFIPTKEIDQIDLRYPYAFSKNMAEQMIVHWSRVYNINYISLRLFNVYGPRSRTNSAYGAALGIFMKQKLSNSPYTVVGDGKQKRDFIHVRDVSKAFYKAGVSKQKNKIFNVGSGKPVTVNYLLRLIGDQQKVYVPKRPGEPNVTHADIKKIKKFLKWKPEISIEKGIKNVLENINYWKSAPLWDKNKIRIATKNWFKYLS